jgi:hypothetical protein
MRRRFANTPPIGMAMIKMTSNKMDLTMSRVRFILTIAMIQPTPPHHLPLSLELVLEVSSIGLVMGSVTPPRTMLVATMMVVIAVWRPVYQLNILVGLLHIIALILMWSREGMNRAGERGDH